MKLSMFMKNIKYTTALDDITVSKPVRDSRQIETGDVFFAISGIESDGHNHAEKALENGASAIVVQHDIGLEKQIITSDTHFAYGVACGNYYDNPAKKLKLVGITGTNGKTTTTYIVKSILEQLGKKTGLIGTIENVIGDISVQSKYTTPDPFQLHSLFSRMAKAGCEYVVMEVSSHAMDQHRLAGCHFEVASFSNLTQDHLDYHITMENYYNAKKQLFSISKSAVINLDDEYGKRLASEISIPILGFSCDNESDLRATNIEFSEKGSTFDAIINSQEYPATFIQPGKFSVYNAMMAAGICLQLGFGANNVINGLKSCDPIPGRFEILPIKQNYTIIRDYAHSHDGLEKLLSTVKSFAKGRIITLFGCAGERDRTKRKMMSAAVAKYSDLCIMTADNPRREPLKQIFEDAMDGFKDSSVPYKIFTDRFDAIVWALQNSSSDDYIVLAGKGHEDYQVLDSGTINFDEREIVMGLLY